MAEELKTLMEIEETQFDQEQIQYIAIANIRPNPYQPRKNIEEEKIYELAQSIKTYGLLQPVIARKSATGYELVAGHRRLLACKKLGWAEVPAIVRELSNSAMATVALIENLQRENLSFLEEAQGYESLIREFKLTQEVLAQRLGKSQSTIANKLRILKLPREVKEKLQIQELTERHARALLKLPGEEDQLKILQEVCNLRYTVQQTEKRVADYLSNLEPTAVKERKKVIIRDIRIFLNTVRQAVSILEAGGLNARLQENDLGDSIEVTIRLPKNKKNSAQAVKSTSVAAAVQRPLLPGQ
ncbi:nucleoid occlusion protein [Dethiobacter alkaliphilus]|uniref:ParB-like partition protein n=1 Tax=Dethiobacter alkaliphilus AHT 1 TaxID=555088 RepID=C0GI80_DETAL|nr:nucleoid occlusion protein [Dethiobacter alkaliphilus]EEG76928.1 parB-like partition protein [Dethiobacter alkaliphilus AHT 1]